MVLDAFANFVRGTVAESIDNSQTTITVTDASIFPDPSVQGEFNVVIWDVNNFPRPDQDTDVEILRVTAIDTGTDTLTVARGQEMTVAAAHPSGSAVHLSPTAKMFSDIEDTFADFWDASAQELTADVNNELVNTGALSLTPVVDVIISVSSGGRVEYGALENPADPYLVSVIPANDPGNDHGYEHHLEWDVSGGGGQGRVDIVINETANSGGGDARILAWRITP